MTSTSEVRLLAALCEMGEAPAYELSRRARVHIDLAHPILNRMTGEGAVARRWQTESERGTAPRRRLYRLADDGDV